MTHFEFRRGIVGAARGHARNEGARKAYTAAREDNTKPRVSFISGTDGQVAESTASGVPGGSQATQVPAKATFLDCQLQKGRCARDQSPPVKICWLKYVIPSPLSPPPAQKTHGISGGQCSVMVPNGKSVILAGFVSFQWTDARRPTSPAFLVQVPTSPGGDIPAHACRTQRREHRTPLFSVTKKDDATQQVRLE